MVVVSIHAKVFFFKKEEGARQSPAPRAHEDRGTSSFDILYSIFEKFTAGRGSPYSCTAPSQHPSTLRHHITILQISSKSMQKANNQSTRVARLLRPARHYHDPCVMPQDQPLIMPASRAWPCLVLKVGEKLAYWKMRL